MDKLFLSKSSYCDCIQCNKMFWLNKYKKDLAVVNVNDNILENGRKVGEFAKGLFGDYVEVPYDLSINKRIEKTKELLENNQNVIAEASFNYDNNFCSVDLLKINPDGVEIYEVKSSTEIKNIYYEDIAYQYYVLSNLGLTVNGAYIVYVNNKYIKIGELDIEQYFKNENVTETVKEMQNSLKTNIENVRELIQSCDCENEPDSNIGPNCFDPYECAFWQYCTKDLPKPNVFDIAGMWTSKKFENYYNGKISFEDLKNEDINEKYLEQIDFELNNRPPKINKKTLVDILDSLKYPLYFIDYESIQPAIPVYDGTKPYQQIPFQYSLHIIKEKEAPLEHKEFLADINDENMIRTFAENMIKDMPEEGSVIVYTSGFESTRNKEIGEMFPDLSSQMEMFNNNMVDLMAPFRARDYYTKEMKGSYSIKYVLPALYPDDPELDYSNLPLVHKGDEASEAFLSLKDKNSEEQEIIRDALLKYCELDTLAMIKIWQNFKQVTNYE